MSLHDLDALRAAVDLPRTIVVNLEHQTRPLALPAVTVTRVDGTGQWPTFRRNQTSAAELIAAIERRARIRDLTLQEPEIDDVVRWVYERGIPDSSGGLTVSSV